MLDPLIDLVKRMIAALRAFFRSLFLPAPKEKPDGSARRFRFLRYGVKLVVVLVILAYVLSFVWHALWVRGYSLAYPQRVLQPNAMVAAGEQVAPAGGGATSRSCGPSQIVDMQIYLIRFLTEENAWVPAMPQTKFGFFGLSWESTPFFDNKASFQHGVLFALRRIAVELADTLGRVRGTSEADRDLQAARGALQYDSETWWFNPFDNQRPFGPVQPSARVYRDSIATYQRFNDRLARCNALFDARADNLRTLIDRITNDLGSMADSLAKRASGRRYDVRTHTFVAGEGNDRGWFDFRADNFFNEASGLVYAYHGLLQAARQDFVDVIETRGISDIWDRMEEHLAQAAALSPAIVSNGREDGLFMPDHLSVMAQAILRSRANMTEIRDVLDR